MSKPPTEDYSRMMGNLLPYGTINSVFVGFNRMRRAIATFKAVPNEPFSRAGLDNLVDAFVHASQDAFHLKDWAKADPDFGPSFEWEAWMKQHEELRALGDLCNASKHGGLGDSHTPHYGKPIALDLKELGYPLQSMSDAYLALELRLDGKAVVPAAFLEACSTLWDKAIKDAHQGAMSTAIGHFFKPGHRATANQVARGVHERATREKQNPRDWSG